ncbi:hypothetical protein LAZ67_11002028 [Cordylochernes scorpioides]|uniref:Uncharacterized protein n=1 Tax=Cordylochernes scorpioides TaxID=51811 RepID=A0ABY6L3R4_9ARAC|nr:hypothetical protein LAZ67_11002028 [Cordylochernes scorpioides]
MKGQRYAMLDEIKTASKEELKKIFKNDFLKCFEDWKNRWHKCIISHGDYFEGDKIDLKLKKTPAKFISRFLTNGQKLCRVATCEDMLEMIRTDPEWKDKIITGDETWVYGYDPETKRQSAEWRDQGKPRPKNPETRFCWSLFWITRALFITNIFLQAKQLLRKCIWAFFTV